MTKEEISIATISWARDEEEETLLTNSLRQLANLNIPVFITDRGSGARFLDFLRSIPNFTVLDTDGKGLWIQTRSSLIQAYRSGYKFILYTEPDKKDFFKDHLSKMLRDISVNDQTGIVLASRSDNSFETFPSFHQMTETAINNCCKEVIGKTFDYSYGPFLMNGQLVPYLESLNPHIGWGWRTYTFRIAKRLGYEIDSYAGDFSCPLSQQKDNPEERIYRMRQLSQNIEGITLSVTAGLH